MERFKKNQPVVCIGHSKHINKLVPLLKEGNIYTVLDYVEPGGSCVFLKEIGQPFAYEDYDLAPLEEDGSTESLAETVVEEYGVKKEEVEYIEV